jgi:hypothetical protein
VPGPVKSAELVLYLLVRPSGFWRSNDDQSGAWWRDRERMRPSRQKRACALGSGYPSGLRASRFAGPQSAVAPEKAHPRQPCAVVLLVDELARSYYGRPTTASTRLLWSHPHRHGPALTFEQLINVRDELPVRKLSDQTL